MAEFASAVLALAGAGAKVGTSLYFLIETVKNAPNEFLALSDEITDFRCMLSRLLDIAGSEEVAAIGDRQAEDLANARLRGEQIVKEIEVLVAKIRKEGGNNMGACDIKRVQWLRYINRAENLRARLRAQKITICNIIALTMVESSARNGLRISQLEMRLDTAVKHQASLMERHMEMLVEVKDSLNPPVEYSKLDPIRQTTKRATHAESEKTAHQRKLALTQRVPNHPGPLQCLEDCQCRCHYRTVVRSPQFMTDWLGDLFVGCVNLPWCFSGLVPCSEQTCRRNWRPVADVRYFLPPWIGQAVGSFTVTFNLRRPPVYVSVHTRNTIPYDSPILICTQEGDVDGVRKLLLSGQASINDIDPYGLGLLYYATYYCWRALGHDAAVNMCRFLLDMGASRDWDDEIGNTPKETLIDNTLLSQAMSESGSDVLEGDNLVHIGQLFGEPTASMIEDFVQDRQLSVLHQVLLGIDRSHGTLDEYLAGLGQCPLPPEMIDVPDASGRTALAWTIEYMWYDAARILLKYGANARQSRPSLRGSLLMLHLVIAGPAPEPAEKADVDTVRLLLDYGADVNAVDHEGWTPLHVAASWNNAAVIRELGRFAGSTLAWDAMTDDKQSAVELALGAGFDPEVQSLLQRRGGSDSEPDEYFDCDEKHAEA